MRKFLLGTAVCLAIAGLPLWVVADDIPPEGKGTEAVALIFVATYNLFPDSTITVNSSTASPPEAGIRVDDDNFLLKRNANEPCRFDLGSAFLLDENEWPIWSERASMIRFDRLSNETKTTTNSNRKYILTVFGASGEEVVCDTLPRGTGTLRRLPLTGR